MRCLNRITKVILLVCAILAIGLYFVKGQWGFVSTEEKGLAKVDTSAIKSRQQSSIAKNIAPTETIGKLPTILTASGRVIANQNYPNANRSNSMPESVTRQFKFSQVSYDQNQQGWKTVKNVIAVPVTPDAQEDPNALARVNHHNLFLSEDSFQDSRGKQIVFNPNRDRVGIISGTIVIELLNQATHNQVISDHSLRVDQYAEGINTLFVSTSSPSELTNLRTALLGDKRIKRIEIEILENSLVRQ